MLISGSQKAREIEFSEQFEPFRKALQDATFDEVDEENAARLSLIKKAIGDAPVIAPVEVATAQQKAESRFVKMTYGILVLVDSLLVAYTVITYIVVIALGADCYVNKK